MENRVIVTFDSDLSALFALSRAKRPSVIFIRIKGLRATQQVEVLIHLLDSYRAFLESGAILSVQAHRVRIKRLPITSSDFRCNSTYHTPLRSQH